MRYLENYNLNSFKNEILTDVGYMILPISDDGLTTEISFPNCKESSLSKAFYVGINGRISDEEQMSFRFKVFVIDDYIDELERVIDYLKEKGEHLFKISTFETLENEEIIDIRSQNFYSFSYPNAKLSEIIGKKCIHFTLSFNVNQN